MSDFFLGMSLYLEIMIESGILMRVYNMEINFSQKVTVNKHQISPSYLDNVKKPACDSKPDGLVLETLHYTCTLNLKKNSSLLVY